MWLLPQRVIEGGGPGEVPLRQGEGGVPDQVLGHVQQGWSLPIVPDDQPSPWNNRASAPCWWLPCSGGCKALHDVHDQGLHGPPSLLATSL